MENNSTNPALLVISIACPCSHQKADLPEGAEQSRMPQPAESSAAYRRGQKAREAEVQRLKKWHLWSDAEVMESCKLQGVTAQRHACAEKQNGTDTYSIAPAWQFYPFMVSGNPEPPTRFGTRSRRQQASSQSNCRLGKRALLLMRLG